MFVILLVNVNYLQAVEAPSLANRPLNDRTEYEQNQVQRGNIVTADGVTIATTKPSNRPVQVPARLPRRPGLRAGHRLRHHLHAVAGAQLRDRRRARGERPADRHRVAARVPQLHRHAHQQAAEGRDRPGHDQLQGAAGGLPAAAAGPRRARPSTASSRSAAWSRSTRPPARSWPWPPTRATTRTSSRCTTPPSSTQIDSQLTAQNPSPLLNNATQTTLPPGSTFKIVTSSAWYNQDSTRNPNTVVDSPQPLKLPNGNLLNNDNNEQCGDGSGKTPVHLRVRPVLQHPVRQASASSSAARRSSRWPRSTA